MAHIHPTAVVDPNAKLADDVELGAYAVVGADVELASGVQIGSHVHLEGRTTVGEGTRIFPFAAIGGEPQVLGFSGPTSVLLIGRDNVIREHTAIHVGTVAGGGCTKIGDNNLIMNSVHIAHDCNIGSNCIIATFTALAGHVSVGACPRTANDGDRVIARGGTDFRGRPTVGQCAASAFARATAPGDYLGGADCD